MKRKLIIMRHAKSSWNNAHLSDHERPLNGRGRRSAPQVAQQLSAGNHQPEIIFSSDSTRTTETWLLMQDELDHLPATYLRELYLGGWAKLKVLELDAKNPQKLKECFYNRNSIIFYVVFTFH